MSYNQSQRSRRNSNSNRSSAPAQRRQKRGNKRNVSVVQEFTGFKRMDVYANFYKIEECDYKEPKPDQDEFYLKLTCVVNYGLEAAMHIELTLDTNRNEDLFDYFNDDAVFEAINDPDMAVSGNVELSKLIATQGKKLTFHKAILTEVHDDELNIRRKGQ